MMKPEAMSAEELVALLRFAADRAAEFDSFDGTIEWHITEDRMRPFEVVGAIRYGNTLGQGFTKMIGTYEADSEEEQ